MKNHEKHGSDPPAGILMKSSLETPQKCCFLIARALGSPVRYSRLRRSRCTKKGKSSGTGRNGLVDWIHLGLRLTLFIKWLRYGFTSRDAGKVGFNLTL